VDPPTPAADSPGAGEPAPRAGAGEPDRAPPSLGVAVPPGTEAGAPRRRFPEPLILVLAGVALGMTLTWLHHPRVGLYLVASSVAVAALLRIVLPGRDAGLLVVRSRLVDGVVLAALAAALIVLASVTPFPAPGH